MHVVARKQLASLLWPKFSSSIDAVNRNAQMFASIRGYEGGVIERCTNRLEMYSGVNKRLGNQAITYLEFGVWKGESLQAWTSLNTNEGSRFYGFDSFEGLPEQWDHGFGHATERQEFDMGGAGPTIVDPRVRLVKGWFQQTLRGFLLETELHHPVVVHVDSDLHSSAMYTLCTLDPILRSGDVVIFDEYTSPSNEFLAWEEYKRAFMRSARCIAMSNRWSQIAFVLE